MGLLLNADVGEIEDQNHGIEHGLIPLIDMANISCGYHAGSHQTMANTLAIALEHGVRVGAHPGYADRENFGRLSIPHSPEELQQLIHQQTDDLKKLAQPKGVEVSYIKPHGALYNDMVKNRDIRLAVFAALGALPPPRTLVMLATGDWQQHQKEAQAFGILLMFEAFADRRYTADGNLLNRSLPGSVLEHAEMLDQVASLVADGLVYADNHRKLVINADTLCVHGDTPDALAATHAIRLMIDHGN